MYSKNPYQGAMYKSVHSAAIRILEKSRRYVQYRFVHRAVIWDLVGRYCIHGAMYKNVHSAVKIILLSFSFICMYILLFSFCNDVCGFKMSHKMHAWPSFWP